MSAAKTTAIDDNKAHEAHACARLSLFAPGRGLANRVSTDSEGTCQLLNVVFGSLRDKGAIAETHPRTS